jgi:hypothetical protein
MKASRRVAAVLSGLAMAGAISTGPALAAAGKADSATSNPSQGFCNASEDGDLQPGGDGHLYRCTYVWGLGWYWMPA